ncbi:alpha-amylase family glycosyl hydrolase [Sporolactobacillus sp. CQH2019]|uniref:alpha-amylase family glycosyl hydrolase n=1 Tax=Sporolactobacillus sp. CQH2019 TaxID=3023512 RepID=UPI00236899EA|nr:alpha-amylase family glycosyl hydrolase [Sporolactobacillus sp. CQH2019]MDD9149765.1 alpha-amylase family glycosyl hydrolase [Sporolactobacillus sp. CQH2019]
MDTHLLLSTVNQHLGRIYTGSKLNESIKIFDDFFKTYKTPVHRNTSLSEKNAYLITYGDAFFNDDKAGLQVLKDVVDKQLKGIITDIHLLPMFPFTSDDGFAVSDYLKINPILGDWEDIDDLSHEIRLMFDFVANHSSKSSEWFQKFLEQASEFENAYIRESANFDASKVTRPRTSPLFHHYKNDEGKDYSVWTTFSEDQVDNNVGDPKTLLRLTEVLLTYIERGASSIRLDAIGFLWKESGTACMHLRQTHQIVKMWRSILNEVAPGTQIITETNVPEQENLSYFGNGSDEANQVYQFPLPPLVLFSLTVNNSKVLSNWAKHVKPISSTGTYFNFLASHDGIGMRPVEDILSRNYWDLLARKVEKNGGRISYKTNQDGSRSIYELNINYSDALRNDGENDQVAAGKMVAAHHILLSFLGVPAIYYHSLFGSQNDVAGMRKSGNSRQINREKLDENKLFYELKHNPYRRTIFEGIKRLLKIRQHVKAFNPYGVQNVLDISNDIFSLQRTDPVSGDICLTYTNLTPYEKDLNVMNGIELISDQNIRHNRLHLGPYGIAWIKPKK